MWVVAPAAGIYGKLMENALPSFWTDALGRIFADTRPFVGQDPAVHTPDSSGSTLRRAKPLASDKLQQRARQLRGAGYSYGEIAKMLGISKTRAHRLVNRT